MQNLLGNAPEGMRNGEWGSSLTRSVPAAGCHPGPRRGYGWQPQPLLHPTINQCLLIREATSLYKHFHLLFIK